ncbi:CBS domain-containing protein [Candidatus Nitrospira salsa]
MIVDSVMIAKVVTVEMDDSLEYVRGIFLKASFHHLLVSSENYLEGVITEKDLWQALSPYVGTFSETDRDLATLQKRAHQIMRRHHPTVSREMTIEDAAHLLLDKDISCLPVVKQGGIIEGIVTWKDIFRAILSQSHQ